MSSQKVVVFDLDETLIRKFLKDAKNFTECEHPSYTMLDDYDLKYKSCDYLFLPHLKVLFSYLLKRNARIAFFSNAPEGRNRTVLNAVLNNFFGSAEFDLLVSSGQFEIFSNQHMMYDGTKFPLSPMTKDIKKDMNIVLKQEKGETLDDIILVDDDVWVSWLDGQKVHINGGVSYSDDNYFKTNIYYFLGIFKSYFENEQLAQLPLREGMTQVLQPCLVHREEKLPQFSVWMYPGRPAFEFYNGPPPPFKLKMCLVGLEEVRKTAPEALFYAFDYFLVEYADQLTVPAEKLHHTAAQITAILDLILSGERQSTEPTMAVFLEYLQTKGFAFHPNSPFLSEKYEQVKSMIA